MGNPAALKAKLQELGYDWDGDMAVGAVIAPEVTVHLTAADMHIDCDAALLVVQSLKARVCVIIYYPAACGPKAHGSSSGLFYITDSLNTDRPNRL